MRHGAVCNATYLAKERALFRVQRGGRRREPATFRSIERREGKKVWEGRFRRKLNELAIGSDRRQTPSFQTHGLAWDHEFTQFCRWPVRRKRLTEKARTTELCRFSAGICTVMWSHLGEFSGGRAGKSWVGLAGRFPSLAQSSHSPSSLHVWRPLVKPRQSQTLVARR